MGKEHAFGLGFVLGMAVALIIVGVIIIRRNDPKWEDKENMIIKTNDTLYRIIPVKKNYTEEKK